MSFLKVKITISRRRRDTFLRFSRFSKANRLFWSSLPNLVSPGAKSREKRRRREKITFLRVSKGKTSDFGKFWSFPPQLSVPPWFREKSARRGGHLVGIVLISDNYDNLGNATVSLRILVHKQKCSHWKPMVFGCSVGKRNLPRVQIMLASKPSEMIKKLRSKRRV